MNPADARYFARSASERTADWPFWFIADRHNGNLNATARLFPELSGYMPFVPRDVAEEAAARANEACVNG